MGQTRATRSLIHFPYGNTGNEERPPGVVCDLPLIGSLRKIRYHRLEVRVFLLLTFHFVEQRLAVKHQTVFQ